MIRSEICGEGSGSRVRGKPKGLFPFLGILLVTALGFRPATAGACLPYPHYDVPRNSLDSQGLTAIFRDDFPFKISRQSGDPRLVIPPARPHCRVKLLNDGAENFALRAQLMRNARRRIDLQTYLFEGDTIGRETLGIFQEKMAAGVPVRLIIHAYIRLGKKSRQFFEEIERAGIFIGGYEPPVFSFLNQNYLPSLWQTNMGYHEKYLVVDDQAAITGGTNIGDEYAGLGAAPGLEMRDLDALFTGPVVEDMRRAFEQNYQEFQELESSRPLLVHRLFHHDRPRPQPENRDPAPAENYLGLGGFTDDDATVRLIRSRPRKNETYIYQAYLFLFRTAKKSILLENSYFIPDRRLLEAICAAARRGVEVKMIVDIGKPKDQYQMQPAIARYYYLPLLEAGVKLYEWKTAETGEGTLHSKISVFDDEVSVIGSYNFDPRCSLLNTEDVVVIDSKKVAADLKDYISTKDEPRCELITREKALAWRRPKSLTRLAKLFMAMAIKYYW